MHKRLNQGRIDSDQDIEQILSSSIILNDIS